MDLLFCKKWLKRAKEYNREILVYVSQLMKNVDHAGTRCKEALIHDPLASSEHFDDERPRKVVFAFETVLKRM